MADTSCSAVLIARDEEPVIEDCLRSLRNLVDEIVVLDTGSVDRTKERAREAGARVVEAHWRDDFAAARNEALGHARGSWILSIDADERIVSSGRDSLAPLLSTDRPLAYRVWLRLDAAYTPYRHCRLFRNRPDIRFEGRIRESVMPSIRRLASRDDDRTVDPESHGRLIGDCDLSIEHYDTREIRDRKHARDLPLLRQALEDDRDSVLYWTDLGRALAAADDLDAAMNAWEQAIMLVRRHDRSTPADSIPYTDLLQRSGSATDAGRPMLGEPARRALLHEASIRFPENHLLAWLRAEALIAEERFAEAECLLLGLAALDGDRAASPDLAYDRRIFGEFACAALATCCVRGGRWSDAAGWYERAERAQPGNLEYRAKRLYARSKSS